MVSAGSGFRFLTPTTDFRTSSSRRVLDAVVRKFATLFSSTERFTNSSTNPETGTDHPKETGKRSLTLEKSHFRQVGLLRSWASSQVNARHDAGTENQNATRRGDVEGSS